MVTKDQIKRINELYRKQKGEGLTDEERIEQKELRQLYIDSVKASLRSQLENIEIVSPEEYKRHKEKECHDENCCCDDEN